MFRRYFGWTLDCYRIRNNHSNLTSMPTVSEGLFLSGPIFLVTSVPLIRVLGLAYPFIFLNIIAVTCKVVNATADASQG